MAEPIVVLVTAPNAGKAAEIAHVLVEEQLAACGNVINGLRSIYRWEGKIYDEPEALLILKTTAANFEPLRARVRELHPYECPEVIQVRIDAGHPDYLAWIAQNVRS